MSQPMTSTDLTQLAAERQLPRSLKDWLDLGKPVDRGANRPLATVDCCGEVLLGVIVYVRDYGRLVDGVTAGVLVDGAGAPEEFLPHSLIVD